MPLTNHETFRCSASRSPRFEPHGGRCAWWNRDRACGACRCRDVSVCLGYGERLRPAYEECVRGSELRQGGLFRVKVSVRGAWGAWRIYLYLIGLSPSPSLARDLIHRTSHIDSHILRFRTPPRSFFVFVRTVNRNIIMSPRILRFRTAALAAWQLPGAAARRGGVGPGGEPIKIPPPPTPHPSVLVRGVRQRRGAP